MEKKEAFINIKGKKTKVTEYFIDNKKFVIKGKIVKTVLLKDEWFDEIESPNFVVDELKKINVKIDLFSFVQRLPETQPKFDFHFVWDNVAAIPVETYEKWITTQIKRQARNKIRKSVKEGITVKVVEFNDEFIKEFSKIINETPIRQGRPYWHYGKNFDSIKRDYITYFDKATYLGAYYKEELIGFVKLVNADRFMRMMGIISMMKYRDLAPMNALVAKSVEICAKSKTPFLVYDKAIYGKKKQGALLDFKKYNGFMQINIPRYFIPLTFWGKIAIKLKLFRRSNEYFPEGLIYLLIKIREKYYNFKYRKILLDQKKNNLP
jgi:hypothetical protein